MLRSDSISNPLVERVGAFTLGGVPAWPKSIVYNRDFMKLAIVGTRGIPANYGGFETFAEELATRLVARGHDVCVYGRSNNIRYPHRLYKGVRLQILPTIGTKHFDT